MHVCPLIHRVHPVIVLLYPMAPHRGFFLPDLLRRWQNQVDFEVPCPLRGEGLICRDFKVFHQVHHVQRSQLSRRVLDGLLLNGALELLQRFCFVFASILLVFIDHSLIVELQSLDRRGSIL